MNYEISSNLFNLASYYKKETELSRNNSVLLPIASATLSILIDIFLMRICLFFYANPMCKWYNKTITFRQLKTDTFQVEIPAII